MQNKHIFDHIDFTGKRVHQILEELFEVDEDGTIIIDKEFDMDELMKRCGFRNALSTRIGQESENSHI